MPNRTGDTAAVTITGGAIIWAPYLEQLNQVLTALSLLLGIAFLLWQWRQAAKRKGA